MWLRDGAPTTMADGAGPMTDGIDYQMNRGRGPRIITVVGTLTTSMDGCGFPAMIGPRPGSSGSMAGTVWDGRP